jgi:hypothetical protein
MARIASLGVGTRRNATRSLSVAVMHAATGTPGPSPSTATRQDSGRADVPQCGAAENHSATLYNRLRISAGWIGVLSGPPRLTIRFGPLTWLSDTDGPSRFGAHPRAEKRTGLMPGASAVKVDSRGRRARDSSRIHQRNARPVPPLVLGLHPDRHHCFVCEPLLRASHHSRRHRRARSGFPITAPPPQLARRRPSHVTVAVRIRLRDRLRCPRAPTPLCLSSSEDRWSNAGRCSGCFEGPPPPAHATIIGDGLPHARPVPLPESRAESPPGKSAASSAYARPATSRAVQVSRIA